MVASVVGEQTGFLVDKICASIEDGGSSLEGPVSVRSPDL